ncbi:MAG: MFS transporter [Verrucomicrobiota bacterium]
MKIPSLRFLPFAFLAFFSGLYSVMAQDVSALLIKTLGFSNEWVGYSSILILPWSINFLVGPWVDRGNPRVMVAVIQSLAIMLLCVLSWALWIGWSLHVILGLLLLLACVGAFYETINNALYLKTFDISDQAYFSGFKAGFLRLGLVLGGGILIQGIGYWQNGHSVAYGWMIYFLIIGVMFLLSLPLLNALLKTIPISIPRNSSSHSFFHSISLYFRQKEIVLFIFFLLLFRFGEGISMRLVIPFYLDLPTQNGLGLSVKEVGFLKGVVSLISSVLGGLGGGWLISKKGLRSSFLLLALCMILPNIFYVYMALVLPTGVLQIAGLPSFHFWALIAVIIEYLGYGMGFAALFNFVCQRTDPEHAATHFSISAAIWNLGLLLPGMISGKLQSTLGYPLTFICSIAFSIPGLFLIFYMRHRMKEAFPR